MFRWREINWRIRTSSTVINVKLVMGKKLLLKKAKFSITWSIYILTITYHNVWLKIKRTRSFDHTAQRRPGVEPPLLVSKAVIGKVLGIAPVLVFLSYSTGRRSQSGLKVSQSDYLSFLAWDTSEGAGVCFWRETCLGFLSKSVASFAQPQKNGKKWTNKLTD